MVFLGYTCLHSDTKVLFFPMYLYFQCKSFAPQRSSCIVWSLCGSSWLQPSSLPRRNQTSYFWSFGTETDCILFLLACWNFVSYIVQLLACLFVESFMLASGSLFVRQGLHSLSTNFWYVKASKALWLCRGPQHKVCFQESLMFPHSMLMNPQICVSSFGTRLWYS